MTITSDFELLNTKFKQVFLARKYRNRFANLYELIKELDAEIAIDKNDTNFSNLPDSIKGVLNGFSQNIIKRDISEIEANSDYMEMINSQTGD